MREADHYERRFAFLLLDGFSLVSLANATEVLRQVNALSCWPPYDWRMISDGGTAVRSDSSVAIAVDDSLEPLTHRDVIVICGGDGIRQSSTKRIVSWLRREALKGITVAGLCTGSYTMAKAGLLNGRSATIVKEHCDSFREEFPALQHSRSTLTIDGRFITSSGGVASSDALMHIVQEDFGEHFAGRVTDRLCFGMPCQMEPPGIYTRETGSAPIHPKLASIIRKMEENIEEPVAASALAQGAGISLRQLERLFRRHLNHSPKRFYMDLRLQRARNLLQQTEMTVLDIAIACGFGSPSHFSRCYRLRYNTTPYSERGLHSGSRASDAVH